MIRDYTSCGPHRHLDHKMWWSGMSIKAMQWVFEQRLVPADLAVLIALADWADDNGFCFPGHDSILDRVQISRRTLVTTMARLEKMGLLRSERRARRDGSGRTSNAYWLSLDGVQSADSSNVQDLHCANSGEFNVQTVAHIGEPSVEPPVTKTARAHAMPKGWTPNATHIEKARAVGVDLAHQEELFRNWSDANGRTYKNWDAAFTNWLVRAGKWAEEKRGAPSRGMQAHVERAENNQALIAMFAEHEDQEHQGFLREIER